MNEALQYEKQIRSALEQKKFSGCQEIIKAYKANILPGELFEGFVDLLSSWGDSLAGSNTSAARIKYDLALDVLRKHLLPNSSSGGEGLARSNLYETIQEKIHSLPDNRL